MTRGWWGMYCWNGLSADQQVRLITWGNLPLGYKPEGECHNPATCSIESEEDAAPGPRFYCYDCAIAYLGRLRDGTDRLPERTATQLQMEGLSSHDSSRSSPPPGHEGWPTLIRKRDR